MSKTPPTGLPVHRPKFDPSAVVISNPYVTGRCLSEARAGRASPQAGARLGHSATITIAGDAA